MCSVVVSPYPGSRFSAFLRFVKMFTALTTNLEPVYENNVDFIYFFLISISF